ncbi:MAG: alternative ribosome rescue aminoacyl-tRNA hydrolase ArfB [candidate division KSB1 bacterium]|nr:alternative ribosome rescue aminoacyl-tRNA hydrolase ArfB [candidate division KSB1 bacterium]
MLNFSSMIHINSNTAIPENELNFTASTSSGPGGQHVNRTNTKVTLLFDLENSQSLTRQQKDKIHRSLANRINNDGMLSISSQEYKSQYSNKKNALEKFEYLLRQVLKPHKKRKHTRVPRSEKRKRLQNKKHRGEKKKLRHVDWKNMRDV